MPGSFKITLQPFHTSEQCRSGWRIEKRGMDIQTRGMFKNVLRCPRPAGGRVPQLGHQTAIPSRPLRYPCCPSFTKLQFVRSQALSSAIPEEEVVRVGRRSLVVGFHQEWPAAPPFRLKPTAPSATTERVGRSSVASMKKQVLLASTGVAATVIIIQRQRILSRPEHNCRPFFHVPAQSNRAAHVPMLVHVE